MGDQKRPSRNCKKILDPSYIYSTPVTTKQQKKKERRKRQKQLRDKPETIHIDYYCYDIDGSTNGVLAVDDEPCDIQFFTNRIAVWEKLLWHSTVSCTTPARLIPNHSLYSRTMAVKSRLVMNHLIYFYITVALFWYRVQVLWNGLHLFSIK